MINKEGGVNRTQINMVKKHDPEAYKELLIFLSEVKTKLLDELDEEEGEGEQA